MRKCALRGSRPPRPARGWRSALPAVLRPISLAGWSVLPQALPLPLARRCRFFPSPRRLGRHQGGRSAPPYPPSGYWATCDLVLSVVVGAGSFRGCSFAPSPSGRSPPCSPVRRRGASSPSSGRACPATAGRCSQVGKPSAVAPVGSGRGGCPSSRRGRMAASIGQPSESHPPNRRRQNEGRGVSGGGVAGCGWWVKRAVSFRRSVASSSSRRDSWSIMACSWPRSRSRSAFNISSSLVSCAVLLGCSFCSGVTFPVSSRVTAG